MGDAYSRSQRDNDTSRLVRGSELSEPSYITTSRLRGRLEALNREVQSINESIIAMQRARAGLVSEIDDVNKQLHALAGETKPSAGSVSVTKWPTLDGGSPINYTQDFEWSTSMKMRMKNIFGINSFRMCQEGVCNACMDGRDVICIMPTGGGKSLTYQLPAIMNPGCTLVISPLISLITDQILHLREADVQAVMLTSATSNEDSKSIFRRLTTSTLSDAVAHDSDIKLLYVTPERLARSKSFMSLLEKLSTAGKLARIVIDEAHCVSQLGHDFRPDYKKLSVLKQFFPHVPILALSATCPPKVLGDLLKVLRLKPVVDGGSADRSGTVYFTAPLYRRNLHYKIVPKPSSSSAVIKLMVQYISRHHPEDSGIVYCFSKKDTEAVAQGLNELSMGKIRAGVYHADVNDAQKERLHIKWRSGEIRVVCATIAFGLGIDKADVRFVLHHSMSKSLDGFYQESGRAGRDGNDADCVLYYRGQDACRLSVLTCAEPDGQDKLHAMVRFAQELTECRKLQFAQYFSTSSSLSLSAWSGADGGRCGHCDNCTRSSDSISTRDVTIESWQILKVIESATREGRRFTIKLLADLVRGTNGSAFTSGGGTKGKEKISFDLDRLIGGKITMNRGDTEALIIHLLLLKYLKEDFRSTPYAVNVYITLGPQAIRLTRLTQLQIEAGEGSRMLVTFPVGVKPGPKPKPTSTTKGADEMNKSAKKHVGRDDGSDADEESSEVSALDDVDEPGESDDEPPQNIENSKENTSSLPKPNVPTFEVYIPHMLTRKDRPNVNPTSSTPARAPNSPPSFFVSSGDEVETSFGASGNVVATKTSGADNMALDNSSDSDFMLDEEGWSFSMSTSASAGTKRTASTSQSTSGGGSSNKRPRVSFDKSATVDVMELSSD